MVADVDVPDFVPESKVKIAATEEEAQLEADTLDEQELTTLMGQGCAFLDDDFLRELPPPFPQF
jgi:hypothetical protein